MSESTFHFRQFTVHQEKCAMKVGTDSVLFGSWIKPNGALRILDIGSGTGIIALMLAQKSSALIDAVEVDENAFAQSMENFKISPWFNRLRCYHVSFQEFAEMINEPLYDLIVSNPPYFHHASKPPETARMNARHTDALTFDELIDGVQKLLRKSGKLCVILPSKEGMEFMDKAQRKGLFCRKLVRVRTKPDKPEKRLIMEFNYSFGILEEEEISIHDNDGAFSEDYILLTKEYYMQLKPAPSPFH